MSKWYVLSNMVGIFNIYQTPNSNSIYNYHVIRSCFKEFNQIGKTSDVLIKIPQANHKSICTQQTKK